MIKNRPFLIRGAPDAPPGAPKASWTAYTAADCTLPPGTLWYTFRGPAPAPGPGETTFTYYFLPLSLYLLASNMCLLVDPHAASLVPRGRRIRKGCALCRRPRKKQNNFEFKFAFELESSFGLKAPKGTPRSPSTARRREIAIWLQRECGFLGTKP